MAFIGEQQFGHGQTRRIGVLLTNLGTPDAPTTSALRRYLAEFLSDRRVVEIPRLLWMIILHGIILRLRPGRSAHNYQSIWTAEGSPLLAISRRQVAAIAERVNQGREQAVVFALGMRYGNPSIASALRELKSQGVDRLIVLPLYPQYSSATTGSTFDAVSAELRRWRWVPELHFINAYHDNAAYIDALVQSIRQYWQAHGQSQRLLFSYHGIPKRNQLQGDPYFCHCHKTSRLVAESLGLEASQWQVSFQSRFGKAEWLQPYTDKTLKQWGEEGVGPVAVVCPGFSADCLETLEEIGVENRDYYIEAGGGDYHYIPALNDSPLHIDAVSNILQSHIGLWPKEDADAVLRQQRAKREGALQ